MDGPFGPACASLPQDGAGSFDGMAQDPVATAASNNPALPTPVTAVEKAGLVDTLQKSTLATRGSGEGCPVDDASKVVCGNVPTASVVDTVLMVRVQPDSGPHSAQGEKAEVESLGVAGARVAAGSG